MLPRYLPEEPLPPYRFVPGRAPHPVRDPHGHSHGREQGEAVVPTETTWPQCRSYLRGIDLFNHGYWWEAHEAWEGAWIAAGRRGKEADFLKGLIHLAAAGVKALEGRPVGVRRHGARSAELLGGLNAAAENRFLGLPLPSLIAAAEELTRRAAAGDSAAQLLEATSRVQLELPPPAKWPR